MSTIKVCDKYFVPFLPHQKIQEKIQELSVQLSRDYLGKKPLFIAILNGSFMFAADLFKFINIEAEICFIKFISYKGTQSTGEVITAIGLDHDVKDRHVIIVEDIIDTGKTLKQFLPGLINQQLASLKIAVLLQKPAAIVHPIKIDYCCFSIPHKFVVGYGMDYNGFGRNNNSIYSLQEDDL